MNKNIATAVAAGICIAAAATPAQAQTRVYNIPAGSLKSALDTFARQSGLQIIYKADDIRPARTHGARGKLSADTALNSLLMGSGFTFRRDRSGAIAIVPKEAEVSRHDNDVEASEQEITVTGSRIKGARLSSPEIRIDREEIQQAGFGDLGAVMRSVPQNFGGGQNPGVGLGASSGGIGNQNVTGGSAVNLRGLGADATLTLLNGHRLSFGGLAQGVDTSAIPIEAIERIEVVPDGSSALYGSDAVAGVVNVLLRRSFEGLALNARIGGATEGGGLSQQYQAVAGSAWQTGNILVAYGYRRNAKVEAKDRPYTENLGEPYQLIRGQSVHSVVVSASQQIATEARFSVDGTFAARHQVGRFGIYGGLSTSEADDRSLSITPSFETSIAGDWRLSLSGTYARSETDLVAGAFLNGVQLSRETACYCHSLYAVEGYAEGSLFALPAGKFRTVLGGGYRRNRFDVHGDTSSYGGSQSDRFLFGEIQLPLFSRLNEVPGIQSLVVTAAARLDSYKDIGSVSTPKLGVVYSPNSSVDLKISWGRSFKAPALAMQFQPRRAYLLPASYFTGGSTSPDATGLVVSGGSDSLRPERATSISGSLALHPVSVPGLTAEITLFRVKYRDRVITPIGNFSDALNPIHADYVTRNPSSDQILAAITDAGSGFTNYTGRPVDPSQIIYFIDNHNRNVAAQKISGVDANIRYRHELDDGAIIGTANMSWLRSRQKNAPSLDYFDLAGSIWNPPHFRGRGGIGWEGRSLQIFAYLNYIGGVDDRRTAAVAHGSAMVTADASVNYTIGSSVPWLNGLRIGLVAENLFNERPPYLAAAPYSEPYDSTNYSPVGRFIALSLSKQF